MAFFENVAVALAGLKANKMRAFLTMLGIIIGIGSVIAISTLGSIMEKSVMDIFCYTRDIPFFLCLQYFLIFF